MLPKTRIVSAICLGFGTLFLVLGICIPRYITNDGRLPLDLSTTTMRIYDENSGILRQAHVELLEPSDRNSVTVRMGLSTYDGQGTQLENLVDASIWSFLLDRVDGSALAPATISYQMASPVATIDIPGVWLKFPTNTQASMYQYFDYTLRSSRQAIFEDSFEKDGRTIYHFHQHIDPTNISLLYEDLSTTTTIDGETYYLFHSVQRDIYVDQKTGLIINIEENIHDYYGDENGNEVQDYLTFQGSTPQDLQEEFFNQAKAVPTNDILHIFCWVLNIIGFGLVLIGIAGTFGAVDGRVRKTVKFIFRRP